jgi:hypothetical protein
MKNITKAVAILAVFVLANLSIVLANPAGTIGG